MQEEKRRQLFQDILDKHKGILLKVAGMYCQEEADRQDLVQEILVQIWQSLHRYDERFALSTWLYRVSLNIAISHFRKSRSRTGHIILTDEPPAQIADAELSGKDHQLNLLHQFIAELRDLDKALMLLYLEEKSHAEIAEILGISTTNVATRIGRIKETLRKRFSTQKN
jgi:RNA polymerase sigma-70 factor (ECF subfamily)